MIGFRGSQVMYWGMVILAYGVAGVLALGRHRGSALAFLTVPIAMAAMRDCKPEVTIVKRHNLMFDQSEASESGELLNRKAS